MRSKLEYADYVRIHESASNKRISYKTISRWYNVSENYVRIVDKIFCNIRDNKTMVPYLTKNASVIAAAQVYYARLAVTQTVEQDNVNELLISLLKETNKLLEIISKKLK